MDVNKALLQKYYQGHCNEVEKQTVEEWLLKPDAFISSEVASNSSDAKYRMWKQIHKHIIDGKRKRRYVTMAACLLLLFTASVISWNRFNRLPPESVYVIIDNTRSNLLAPQLIGNILLSESANSALKFAATANNQHCLLYANSLIINNEKGEDIWVYLKTSSRKGSGMMKFLCRKKRTYVAGFITEHSATGNRKYLYSQQSSPAVSLPEEIATGINSQLNAAKINAKHNGNATIII